MPAPSSVPSVSLTSSMRDRRYAKAAPGSGTPSRRCRMLALLEGQSASRSNRGTGSLPRWPQRRRRPVATPRNAVSLRRSAHTAQPRQAFPTGFPSGPHCACGGMARPGRIPSCYPRRPRSAGNCCAGPYTRVGGDCLCATDLAPPLQSTHHSAGVARHDRATPWRYPCSLALRPA